VVWRYSPGAMEERAGPAKFVVSDAGNGLVYVAVHGEVDVATAPQLSERLRDAIRSGARRIEVNLAACTFLDSSGLNVLVVAFRDAQSRGGDLVVVKASGSVASVLSITGLDSLLGGGAARG
jgi:anti-sigma B factor antagonist